MKCNCYSLIITNLALLMPYLYETSMTKNKVTQIKFDMDVTCDRWKSINSNT